MMSGKGTDKICCWIHLGHYLTSIRHHLSDISCQVTGLYHFRLRGGLKDKDLVNSLYQRRTTVRRYKKSL